MRSVEAELPEVDGPTLSPIPLLVGCLDRRDLLTIAGEAIGGVEDATPGGPYSLLGKVNKFRVVRLQMDNPTGRQQAAVALEKQRRYKPVPGLPVLGQRVGKRQPYLGNPAGRDMVFQILDWRTKKEGIGETLVARRVRTLPQPSSRCGLLR